MVLKIIQAQLNILKFNNLSVSQHVHNMVDSVNFLLSPFEGGINPRDIQGINIYIHSTEDIENEAKTLDISVLKAKGVVKNLLSLANKYVWGRLELVVYTGAVNKHFFNQVEQVNIHDIQV